MKTYTNYANVVRLAPCTYGVSRLSFRGPRRPTDGRFVAFLGGSDTFARYILQPFSNLVETATGEVCVNLGCQAAGPDVYLKDTAVQAICHDASAVVLQVIGAANLSNAYYRVHPRRNDRFIAPTDRLTALFPEVDFSEISFTGHLISRLRSEDEARFALVRTCLQSTWMTRMRALIDGAAGKVFLLWFASRYPSDDGSGHDPSSEPVFVTASMLEDLRSYVEDIIEVVEPRGDTTDMAFAPLDTLAAQDSLGAAAHNAAAKALRVPLTFALS
ncbi:DUF6473 family protein [Octadecabacter sp.]|nr:DUF6473 family protein [Octadecabacter sp.]